MSDTKVDAATLTEKELNAALRSASKTSDTRYDKYEIIRKTVDTFSGIIGRDLEVTHSDSAWTDGKTIAVPLPSPYAYQLAEHEIAHNLFMSNCSAKELFVKKYVDSIASAFYSHGQRSLNGTELGVLAGFLNIVVNVFEDHRVNSLWASMYPGSYNRLREFSAAIIKKSEKNDSTSNELVRLLLCLSYNIPVQSSGFLSILEPHVRTALKMLEHKSPEATFVISRWFLTNVISEIVKESKQQDNNNSATQENSQAGKNSLAGGSGASLSSGDSSVDSSDADDSSDVDNASSSSIQSGNSSSTESSARPSGSGKDEPSPTAPVARTSFDVSDAKDRANALETLLKDISKMKVNSADAVHKTISDVHKSTAHQPSADIELVANANKVDIHNAKALEEHLKQSSRNAEEFILAVEEKLANVRQISDNDWLIQSSLARVTFKDHRTSYGPSIALGSQDKRVVSALREFNRRLKLRKRLKSEPSGTDIDIEQHISNIVGKTQKPPFRDLGTSRGIHALFLLDRSGSMEGEAAKLTESAAAILECVFNEPGTKLEFWGFHSEWSTAVVSRYSPSVVKSRGYPRPHGGTPLESATKAALRHLSRGGEKKILFVLTDGNPTTSDSTLIKQSELFTVIGKEVRSARQRGIFTVGIVVGKALSDQNANTMFGGSRNWRRVSVSNIRNELVRLFTSVVDNISNAT
jgi:hypothetical protein